MCRRYFTFATQTIWKSLLPFVLLLFFFFVLAHHYTDFILVLITTKNKVNGEKQSDGMNEYKQV